MCHVFWVFYMIVTNPWSLKVDMFVWRLMIFSMLVVQAWSRADVFQLAGQANMWILC